jgi:tetratricopeptide (TPR) repeat protein
LNACEGARTSAEDPYTGVAQTLVRQGIPAVLAMQFEIFENAAITLAQEFYSAIVDGYPVDAALSEARKAIFASNNDVEWGTPVLFMRIPNGVLFRPETAAEKAARMKAERLAAEKAARERVKREAEEKRAREQRASLLNHLYEQVKNQIAQEDWSAAIDFMAQIQDIEPNFRDVPSLLELAETERERADKVAESLAQAQEFARDGNWSNATQVLRKLLDLIPGHTEAQHLLVEAETQIKQEQELRERKAKEQRQVQLAKSYEQANVKMAERDWDGASKLLEEIDRTEPGFRDAKKLLNQIQTEQDRQKKLVSLVTQGKEHLGKQEWTKAIDAFQQALTFDPENAEAQSFLEEAKRGEKIKDFLSAAQKQMLAKQWSEAIAKFQTVLELDPTIVEAKRQLDEAKIKLAHQVEEERGKKKKAITEESTSKSARPASFPEEIKLIKPTSLPEEIKSQRKPKNLPK